MPRKLPPKAGQLIIKTKPELAKGTITTSVVDFAESNQADLIVMGTKGTTGLKEIFWAAWQQVQLAVPK